MVDTYTITYSDGTTSTFTVTNGSDATVDIVTAWNSTTSDSKVPSEKLTKTELDKKIATSSTSGLVKNDGSIMTSGTGSSNWAIGNHTHSAYVNPTKVTSWSGTPSDNNVASEKLIKDSLDDKANISHTHTVSDVTNFPSTIDPKNNTVTASSTDTKDLDNYTTVGFYNFFNDASIPYVDNKPTGVTHSFFLLVEARSNGNQAKQTLTDYSTGNTYIRTKKGTDNWGTWKEIVDKSYVDNLVGSAITYINQ